MLLDGAAGGFGMSLALTSKTDPGDSNMSPDEKRKWIEKARQHELEKEIGLMINQIGKIDQPPG